MDLPKNDNHDFARLSELHGVFGTYINWWVQCKDWTIYIHKLKQTNKHQHMQTDISSGRSAFGVSCVKCLIIHRLGEPWRLMDDTVWGGGIVRGVSRLVLTCTCLTRTWHEALNCPNWIDSHIYVSGVGLTYLVILRWSRCTPSLRTGDVYGKSVTDRIDCGVAPAPNCLPNQLTLSKLQSFCMRQTASAILCSIPVIGRCPVPTPPSGPHG